MTPIDLELISETQRLLDAIAARDWATYEELCAPDLTCFEAETDGILVEGLPFHRYYFTLETTGPKQTTMADAHVRMLGENAAVVGYVRLVQSLGDDGKARTSRFAETRVWERREGRWVHVHFHRS